MDKRSKKLGKEIIKFIKINEIVYYQLADGDKIDATRLPGCNKILVLGFEVKKEK